MHLVVHAWERYVRIVAAPFSEEYRGQFRLKYADDFERLRVFYNGGRHVRRILADIGYKRFGMGLTSVSEGVWSLAAVCTDAFYTELGDYVAAKLRSYSDDDGPQTVADVVALEPPGHDLDRRLKVVWGAPPDQTIVFVRAENNGGRVVLGALDLLALVKLVGERGILPKASDAPETTAAAKRNFEVDPDDHTVRADSDSLNAEDVWQLLDVIGYDAEWLADVALDITRDDADRVVFDKGVISKLCDAFDTDEGKRTGVLDFKREMKAYLVEQGVWRSQDYVRVDGKLKTCDNVGVGVVVCLEDDVQEGGRPIAEWLAEEAGEIVLKKGAIASLCERYNVDEDMGVGVVEFREAVKVYLEDRRPVPVDVGKHMTEWLADVLEFTGVKTDRVVFDRVTMSALYNMFCSGLADNVVSVVTFKEMFKAHMVRKAAWKDIADIKMPGGDFKSARNVGMGVKLRIGLYG